MARMRRRRGGRGRPRCATCCSCRRLFIVSQSSTQFSWKVFTTHGLGTKYPESRKRYDELFRWNVGLTEEEGGPKLWRDYLGWTFKTKIMF